MRYPSLLVFLMATALGTGCGPSPAWYQHDRPNATENVDRVGTLASGDLRFGDAFADRYEFGLRRGERVSVVLESTDFDPLLEVVPTGAGPVVNDDWQGSRSVSRVDLVGVADGTIKVRVTSYAAGATGRYRLRVIRGGLGGGDTPGVESTPDAGGAVSNPVATLRLGQSLEGALEAGDETLPDGAWTDTIAVEVPMGRGGELRILGTPSTLRLAIMDPSGRFIAPAGRLRLQQPGVYRVQISAPAVRVGVSYEVHLQRLDRESDESEASPPEFERTHHRPPAATVPARPLTLGTDQTGSFESSDTPLPTGEFADVYTLSGVPGQTIRIELRSDEADTYLMLIGPNGQLWENDDSRGTTNSTLQLTLPLSGSYRVVATTFRAGEVGAYTLKVTDPEASGLVEARDPEPDDSNQGSRLELEGELTESDARLANGEFIDRYTVLLEAGQRVQIDLSSETLDTYLIVQAPDGRPEFNDDISPGVLNSRLHYEVRTSGPHTIGASSYEAGATGAYRLELQGSGPMALVDGAAGIPAASSTAPEGVSVGGWQQQAGELADGDRQLQSGEFLDEYSFEWAAGEEVHLRAQSSEFDTYLIVISPSSQQQDNDDETPPDTDAGMRFVVQESGRHRVLVTSYRPGEVGRYQLLVNGEAGGGSSPPGPGNLPEPVVDGDPPEPATSPPAVTSPPSTSTDPVEAREIRGELTTSDTDIGGGKFGDVLTLSFPAGRAVQIRLDADFDTFLMVETPSGQRLQNDDVEPGTLNSGLDIVAAEAGEYRITVTSYRPGDTGPYVLTVGPGEEVPGPAGPGADNSGGRVFGVFAGITDYPAGVGDLPECANDAIKLAETLRNAGLLTEDRQVLLTDAQATLSNIRSAMATMASRVGPNDTFVFFFSGHGSRHQGTEDAREIDGADETIVMYDGELLDDELGRLFDGIRGRVSILALDSCFAGGFAKDVITQPRRMGLFSSEEDVLSGVASRFQAGGYLSHFLRAGLQGNADMDPRDQVLTAGELTHYVYQQFATHARDLRMSTGYQHLVVDRGAVRPDFVLWRY